MTAAPSDNRNTQLRQYLSRVLSLSCPVRDRQLQLDFEVYSCISDFSLSLVEYHDYNSWHSLGYWPPDRILEACMCVTYVLTHASGNTNSYIYINTYIE